MITARGARALACLFAGLMLHGRNVAAQAAAPTAPAISTPVERAVTRARALVENGEGADARALLDSLVRTAPPASADLAEALFWRGVLAEKMADAERDWKRLIIDMPLMARTPDALHRLAELEELRGRPAAARGYHEQVVREFPSGMVRTRSVIWLARTALAQRDAPRGCAMIATMAPAEVPEGELRLQLEALGRQCASLVADSSAGPTASSTPPSGTARSAVMYSVQLGAYDTRKEAEARVKQLKGKEITARIDGDEAPFRVRVGRYETRAEATAQLAKLKKRGMTGFVAELRS